MAGRQLPVVRRSDVETFGCPFRYNQIVNLGIDDTGDEILRGRAVHAAHYVYILLLAQHRTRQDWELAKEAFVQGLAICPVPDHLVDECEKLFFRYAERFELDLDRYYSAEEVIARQAGGRRFQPDLLYIAPQEVEIIDIKTYYRALTETQAAKELQLRWYLVEAVRAFPGWPSYRFTFDFIRVNRQVSLAFTADQIGAFEPGVDAQVAAVERAREAGEYPPMPGSHCTLCRLACPIQDQPGRLPGRILHVDQARDIGGRILSLEQQLKALRKVMGGWCSIDGPVEINGQVFVHRQEISKSIPADVVAEQCDRFDVPLGNLWTPAAAVRRLFKGLGGAPWGPLTAATKEAARYKLRHMKAGEFKPDHVDDVLAPEPEDDGGGDDED